MTLKLKLVSGDPTQARVDALVVVVFEAEVEEGTLAALDQAFEGALMKHLERSEFSGRRLQTLELPTMGRFEAHQLILVGAGPRDDGEGAPLAAAVAAGVRAALGAKATAAAVVLPPRVQDFRRIGEAVGLGAYRFTKYLTGSRKPTSELGRIDVYTTDKVSAEATRELALGQAVAEGVCVARDAVNEPPNELYPATFAEWAKAVAKKNKLAITVLDDKALERKGHRLHVAVGQGSVNKPRLMHLTYAPSRAKRRLVFVGKGLTFDSGGLCIKPMQGMAEMKMDMAGGGAVLGLMAAVAAVRPDVEVHGIIGAAENMPDAAAYRPADVIRSLSGKTVEVINTDAEGRLVLADTLTYATKLEPDAIIDAATLTGATLVSLGQPYSAFYSTSEKLAAALESAAQEAGESFWRMPLIEELASQLKSDVADLKHVGDRFGGAITAALFLREFVDDVPWIHCDIPGAVMKDRPSGLYPKGATGHPVLTFLRLVEGFAELELEPTKAPAEKRSRGAASKKSSKRSVSNKPASDSGSSSAKSSPAKSSSASPRKKVAKKAAPRASR